jgi:hypothetical protein
MGNTSVYDATPWKELKCYKFVVAIFGSSMHHSLRSTACQITAQSCTTSKAVKSVQIGTHLVSLKVEPRHNFNSHTHAQCPKISKDLLL